MRTVDQVIEFLKQNNDLDGIDIQADSKLIADLGLTSFELLEMCYHLEREFQIELDEDDLAGIETVSDIAQYMPAV
ncbi:MAG: acyl carrier protein [Clostridiales bacterium]|jgi:acyl carrier protein|nr:acyl carrier protein [Clostridiales bacterium]